MGTQEDMNKKSPSALFLVGGIALFNALFLRVKAKR